MHEVLPHSARRPWQPAIAVIVPVGNGASGLDSFHRRRLTCLAGNGAGFPLADAIHGDLKMLENTGDFRLMRVPVAGKIPM
jgi:hypothetical protein